LAEDYADGRDIEALLDLGDTVFQRTQAAHQNRIAHFHLAHALLARFGELVKRLEDARLGIPDDLGHFVKQALLGRVELSGIAAYAKITTMPWTVARYCPLDNTSAAS